MTSRSIIFNYMSGCHLNVLGDKLFWSLHAWSWAVSRQLRRSWCKTARNVLARKLQVSHVTWAIGQLRLRHGGLVGSLMMVRHPPLLGQIALLDRKNLNFCIVLSGIIPRKINPSHQPSRTHHKLGIECRRTIPTSSNRRPLPSDPRLLHQQVFSFRSYLCFKCTSA